MNENCIDNFFQLFHNRRSIRKFLDKPITDDVLFKILNAGIRAPFAAQLCSMVYTRDKDKIKQFGTGAYPTTQVMIIFFIDARRIERIAEKRGHKYDFDDTLLLWLGIQDVSLVVENIIMAAEAMGLGSVLLGGVPNNVNRVTKMFNMPKKRVFPVVGMCLGYPDPSENTQPRPRYPLKYTAYEDNYKDLNDTELEECMSVMDEGYLAQDYYKSRDAKIPLLKGEDKYDYSNYSWTEHISRKICQGNRRKTTLFEKLKKYGFILE